MGKDLSCVSQYELTNDIIKNHFVFDIKDGALKVLLILSTHYPEILVQRKSLIKRYQLAEKTVDRSLKELEEKNYINRQNDGKITINLTAIYGQIGGKKVVNLAVTCSKQQESTNKANKHVDNSSQIDGILLSVLSGFGFSVLESQKLVKEHSVQTVQKYVEYMKTQNVQNSKKYLLWCLKEKPSVQTVQQVSKQTNNAERYSTLLASNKANWMNNQQYAETYLVNTTQFDLRNENILKDCIAIMLHWKFNISDYSALSLIDNAAAENKDFKDECAKMTAEIWRDLQTAKLTVEESKTSQIAC